MKSWPRHPTVFEINTWVWLSDLSHKYGVLLNLEMVPPEDWDAIGELGFDAVWLMGVWERSPAAVAIANRNESLADSFRKALPDFTLRDNVGSPYSVRQYIADPKLGGPRGLQIARDALAQRGMRLILDFVPNHVAPDHPWVAAHPEYFIRGSRADLQSDPSSFLLIEDEVFACGRDPYFPAWPDVLQLNAFDAGLRQAVQDTVAEIASQCDGIRCDMAMLMMNSTFARTWGSRGGHMPESEYWIDLIGATRAGHPYFLFIAEAYWDLEWALQQQGFDFCYDKRLYDRLEHDTAESIRRHLLADRAYQDRLLRFIENHDEPRAAAIFSQPKHRVAAVTMATIPGAKMFHEGQLDGRKIKLPVFLGRRAWESPNQEISGFYRELLKRLADPLFRDGSWNLCEVTGWPDNTGFQNLISWTWTANEDRCLIVVNLSDTLAQARVHVPWDDLSGAVWRLTDSFSGASYDRDSDEVHRAGLYVELGPWSFHFFRCRRVNQKIAAT